MQTHTGEGVDGGNVHTLSAQSAEVGCNEDAPLPGKGFDLSIIQSNGCSLSCGLAVFKGRQLLFVNQALTDILGYTLEELSNKRYMTLLEHIFAEEGASVGAIPKVTSGVGRELLVQTKDGDKKWLQLNHRAMGSGDQGLDIYTLFDITRFKELEHELRISEGKYRAVLEKSPINIYIADLSTLRIIESNPAMQRLLGYSALELQGMTPYDFLEHSHEDIDSKVVGLSAQDFEVVGERRYRRKDGTILEVEVFGNKIDLGDRKAICIVSWDITERNRASQKIMKLNEVLRLTSKITRHDIRNHLSIAYGILGMMREGNQVGEAFIEEAYKAVHKCIDLTKRMAALDAMIMGEDRLYPLDVREVVESVIVDHKVKYTIEGEGLVLADAALVSVIDNIVSNAINHGRTDRMRVVISRGDGQVVVRLSDNGRGIPPELRSRVFDEGFAFGESAGTGLGLSIVRSTMQRYGGFVDLEETDPKGTTVVLTFRGP